jgi:dipeptidyl aminopeptidase/acylaminoacyl peptidase
VGYGGGDFDVANGLVIFADAENGRLFSQPLAHGRPQPLTPGFGVAAAPKTSPDGRWVLFVHSYEGQDSLGIIDSQSAHWPSRIAQGADFYMQPAWHPDSRQIAFIEWDHPNMPWDGTRLVLGRLEGEGPWLPHLAERSILAGGEEISVFQPEFSPDGNWLAYVSDETGWWQVYLHDLQRNETRQLTHEPAEHGLPAWGQGMRSYAFSPDGRSIFYVRNQDASHTLWRQDIASGAKEHIQLPGYAALEQIAVAPDGERIALLASGPAIPLRVLVCRLEGGITVVNRSMSEELPESTYSPPEPITWIGEDGGAVYGLFYPPHSQVFESAGKPPLIVNVHGGPTGQRGMGFSLAAQFFTSRGYAYLDVNYRGSTGYGRTYRNRLRGNWGVYDVQDSVSGALHLAERGLVDGSRRVILGGSAGGYTVLQTLVDRPGFFKAGVCLYGISNQFTLAAETHKFESHYTDSLLGVLPEAAQKYRDRSPLFSLDRIQDPLAIFHGENDVVVPPAQSAEVVAVLQRRGVPYIYHLYPGEGHGFRKTETIEHFYTTVEQFLRQYVIYA